MIKRAFIFLVALSVISIISHSCILRKRFEIAYEWVDFTARPMRTSSSWCPVLWGPAFAAIGDTIAKNDFAFYITMENERLRRKRLAQHGSFSVIPKAMATRLPDVSFIRTNTISSITVKTMYDYSDSFLAGADITSLFEAAHHRYVRQNEIMTIEALISYFKNRQTRMGQGNTTNFFLFLMDDTSIGGKQRFKITITLDDGLVLVQEVGGFILE